MYDYIQKQFPTLFKKKTMFLGSTFDFIDECTLLGIPISSGIYNVNIEQQYTP